MAQLLEGLTAQEIAADVVVRGLENDSRRVSDGDLFCAYRGALAHGLDFLPQALARGAAAVAWDGAGGSALECPQPSVAVPGLRGKIGVIAGRFYAHPSAGMPVIAVTGTDGKTSVAHFVAEALNLSGQRCGLIGTLGAGFFGALRDCPNTTPDALFIQRTARRLSDEGAACLVLEASSHGIDQGRLNGLEIDVAVLTNLGADHLDYHGSRAAYAAAKRRLFRSQGLRCAVLNRDSEDYDAFAAACASEVQILDYSVRDKSATAHLEALSSDCNGLDMRVRLKGEQLALRSSLLGEFNAANLMAALLVLVSRGIAASRAAGYLSQVGPVRGRMQKFECAAGAAVILDYAHTPQALEKVLTACRRYCSGKLVCVFGCGGDRDAGKRPLMGAVASRLADRVVITDDNPRNEDPQRIIRQIKQGAAGGCVEVVRDRKAAIERAVKEARRGDLVVVAGKGHEQNQIVAGDSLPFDDAAVIRGLQ